MGAAVVLRKERLAWFDHLGRKYKDEWVSVSRNVFVTAWCKR